MPNYNPLYRGREFRIQGRTIKVSDSTTAEDLKLIAGSVPDVLASTQAAVAVSKPAPAQPTTDPVPEVPESEESKPTIKPTKKDDNPKS